MAEMVLRRKKRRKGMLDEKRFALPQVSRVHLAQMASAAGRAVPGFLLAMVQLLDMPSGLHAAYIAALAALGRGIRWPMAGVGAAMLLRLLSGLDPRWEGLITLAILLAGPWVLPGRGNGWLVGFTVLAVLPTAVRGCLANTAGEMLLALGATAMAALCAPVFSRGIAALTARAREGQPVHVESLEDRLSVGLLALLTMCGGGRLLLAGMNVGMLAASAGTLLLAMHFGPGVGCVSGLISGMLLAMTGLPMLLAVALAAGGFLAGVMRVAAGRRITCIVFGAAALSPMLLAGVDGAGCAWGLLGAAAAAVLLPRTAYEGVQGCLMRLHSNHPEPGNAYAASMLSAWEKTVGAMAMAVPYPTEEIRLDDGRWWRSRLCEGCPEAAACDCMESPLAVEKARSVWAQREAEEPAWMNALEELRGLGCQRLYQLWQGMAFLRQEAAANHRHVLRARDQRSMLVTHLSAMAGAARRFAYLSAGENWWDVVTGRRIRRALAEAASPVQLLWVRRVQGHVQAAFELQSITGARRQAEEMCALVEAVCGAPMQVVRVDGDRVQLSETPLLSAQCGVCSASAEQAGEGVACGDTAWSGALQDGRYMAALSDGMGHGEQAALTSRQTVELLRLCLDAGYTRQQTLTAVNGMLMLGGQGERFTTVDMLTIDLWSGAAALDKQGAASSWLWQQDALREVTGDALPLGILENIGSDERLMRLQAGDAIVLMTDGVEDAFSDRAALQDAILLALTAQEPQSAAESLLDSAQRAGRGRQDDQTVAVIRIGRGRGQDEGRDIL